MKRRAVIEDVIGETRAAVYEGRKLVELHLDRWSQREAPKIGELWTGQIKAIDPSIGGAFVSLGRDINGLLAFKSHRDLPRLTEGALIDVRVTKEPIGKKAASVKFVGDASLDKPGAVERFDLKSRLSRRFPDMTFETAPVGAHDQATERHIAIAGGGQVTIDRTEAMIAIDVDKGGATRTFECAEKAASLIASQLRLRGLGGLIAIDFPNLRQPKQRGAIIRALEAAGEIDPASVRVAPFSRFGVVEMTRGQDGPSLDSILNDRFGRPTVETTALRQLRQITREASAHPGAQLAIDLPATSRIWLDEAAFDWRHELTERIGARFTINEGQNFTVKADR